MLNQIDLSQKSVMDVQLITKTRTYCNQLFNQSRCSNFPFHNWEHTREVVANSKKIARAEHIDAKDLEPLIIAAYFHDVGQIEGMEAHEKSSCDHMSQFLEIYHYPAEEIEKIKNIILATVMPQKPHTLLQKIICDADLAHLGKTGFESKNSKLRNEWALYNGKNFTDEEWITLNIKFLDCHQFHTEYARAYYGQQKELNKKALKDHLKNVSE